MAISYLIRDTQIVAEVNYDGDVISMPSLGGGDMMQLINQNTILYLMNSQGWTANQALSALGLADLRSTMLKSIVIGSDPSSLVSHGVVAYHLISINQYSVWQVDGQQIDLLQLHNSLWDLSPIETLGLVSIVDVFGTNFYDSAVRTATGMTIPEALARRDRIATHLENHGYTNTTNLRASTTEHDMTIGIAEALGYTETQLWNNMVS